MSPSLPLGGAFPFERSGNGDGGDSVIPLTGDPTISPPAENARPWSLGLWQDGETSRYYVKLESVNIWLPLTAANAGVGEILRAISGSGGAPAIALALADQASIVRRRVDVIDLATLSTLGAVSSVESIPFGAAFTDAQLAGCSASIIDALTAPNLSAASVSVGDSHASHPGSVVRAFDGMAVGNGESRGMLSHARPLEQLQFSLSLTGIVGNNPTAASVTSGSRGFWLVFNNDNGDFTFAEIHAEQISALASAQGLAGATSGTVDISSLFDLAGSVGKTITTIHYAAYAGFVGVGLVKAASHWEFRLQTAPGVSQSLAAGDLRDPEYDFRYNGQNIPVLAGYKLLLKYDYVGTVPAVPVTFADLTAGKIEIVTLWTRE